LFVFLAWNLWVLFDYNGKYFVTLLTSSYFEQPTINFVKELILLYARELLLLYAREILLLCLYV
jgi:hypothetical protein